MLRKTRDFLNVIFFAFLFADISARGLKKIMFFQPDTYVKFRIGPYGTTGSSSPSEEKGSGSSTLLRSPTSSFSSQHGRSTLPMLPHQGQCYRTQVQGGTMDPKWVGEFFKFIGYGSDYLEIEVKDKVAKSKPCLSRILGKRKVQLSSLFPQTPNL